MKHPKLLIPALLACAPTVHAAYVDIWNDNGNYATSVYPNSGPRRVVYSGNDYYQAINSGIANLTPGRRTKEEIRIWMSGTHDRINRAHRSINLEPYTILSFHGHSVNVDILPTVDRAPVISAVEAHHCEVNDLRINGTVYLGIYASSSNDFIVRNVRIVGTGENSGIGLRITNDVYKSDYSRYATGFKLLGRNYFSGMSEGNHGLETVNIGRDSYVEHADSTDMGGCSVLLNRSRDFEVGTVVGRRCGTATAGYASFRTANDCGPNIHVDKVVARDCARGLFSVSKSYGLSVDEVDLQNSLGHGILLQWWTDGSTNPAANRIGQWGRSSYIYNSGDSGMRVDDGFVNTDFINLTFRSNVGGVRETDGSGRNRYRNCDVRGNTEGGKPNLTLGPGSTFDGYR